MEETVEHGSILQNPELWVVVGFIIFLVVVGPKVWKMIVTGLDQRSIRIKGAHELVDVTENRYEPGEAGPDLHEHREHADAFYVLVSGHLQATVGGRVVRELTEGDGFGEIALLQGGKRTATITVDSADAEVLVMRRQDFESMLATMPAFAWGIWETATTREESSRSEP